MQLFGDIASRKQAALIRWLRCRLMHKHEIGIYTFLNSFKLRKQIKKALSKRTIKGIVVRTSHFIKTSFAISLHQKRLKRLEPSSIPLDDALRDDIVVKNLFTHIKSPVLVDVREKPFSVEEIFKILEYADEKMRSVFRS